jgi:hypothetical protein
MDLERVHQEKRLEIGSPTAGAQFLNKDGGRPIGRPPTESNLWRVVHFPPNRVTV